MPPLLNVVPLIEVALISIIVYYLLTFFWNTRAMDLIFGLLFFLVLYGIALWFDLPVIRKLMVGFVNVAVLALLIIFQPELRIALSRLSVKGRKFREVTEFDRFLESLTTSVYRLAEKKLGALILIENQDSLDEYANKAVLMHAEFSSELLESIFMPSTPLHDGAVILRGSELLSAATILPLADESGQLSKSAGTRHRAGLGISQMTDALVIVVSEETGKVSIARDGIMTRGIKPDRFRGIVSSIFNPEQFNQEPDLGIIGYLRQWAQ